MHGGDELFQPDFQLFNLNHRFRKCTILVREGIFSGVKEPTRCLGCPPVIQRPRSLKRRLTLENSSKVNSTCSVITKKPIPTIRTTKYGVLNNGSKYELRFELERIVNVLLWSSRENLWSDIVYNIFNWLLLMSLDF